jgi:hypothetical protein
MNGADVEVGIAFIDHFTLVSEAKFLVLAPFHSPGPLLNFSVVPFDAYASALFFTCDK